MYFKSHIKSETREKLSAYITPTFWLLILITSLLDRVNTPVLFSGLIDGLLVVTIIAYIYNTAKKGFGG